MNITKTELKELKAFAAAQAEIVNPEGLNYWGNGGVLLCKAYYEKVEQYLSSGYKKAPMDWTQYVVTLLMQRAYTDTRR
jgi:hypothetical protein